MKSFFFLSAFLLVVNAASYKDLFSEEWNLYKATFKKSYDSEEEDNLRMRVFLDNKLFVAQHNRRYLRGEETFDVEMNQFADWLPEELEKLNGVNASLFPFPEEPQLDREMFVPPPNVNAPDEVNWVKYGAVTSVKDQGKCGSCYAFSAVGALEGQVYIKKKKSESLSVQNILDCSRAQGNQGCNGGFAHFSFQYVQKNNGINSEAVYPYEAKVGQCRFKSGQIAATCNGHVQVEQNERRLKEAVATVGPIATNLDARHQSFILYKSGVYSEAKCHPYTLVHAVLLVGYGVDANTRKEYWLLKNSWNTSWGERGYFRLARNANNIVQQLRIDIFEDLETTTWDSLEMYKKSELAIWQHLAAVALGVLTAVLLTKLMAPKSLEWLILKFRRGF